MSIKKGSMPPRYDETFKAGAVKMVAEKGRPAKEVASDSEMFTPCAYEEKLQKIMLRNNCFHSHSRVLIISCDAQF